MDTPSVHLSGSENQNPNQNGDASANNGANNSVEVEMGGTAQNEGEDGLLLDAPGEIDAEHELEPEPEPPAPPKKNAGLLFLEFLTSPIVEIAVGEGDGQTIMTAHQALICESPFLEEFVNKFESSGPRRIELPTENVEAFGCFLQFQYTRNYTLPVETANGSSQAVVNTDGGEQLLQHARIYTLADKLHLPALKTLAHKKIHRVNSTPGGELAYARYVYTHTNADDTTIRKPIAVYWAEQGHILRHDLTEEFRRLCMEVPEFTYDVLSLSYDKQDKGKKATAEIESVIRGSGRKRARKDM